VSSLVQQIAGSRLVAVEFGYVGVLP